MSGDNDNNDDEKEADRKIEKAGAVEGTGGTAAVYLDPSPSLLPFLLTNQSR